MVDFKKKLKGNKTVLSVDPIEIYDKADRRLTAGPLRPVQATVLDEWYKNRKTDKDIIIKLHTGEGKTLIGLLILQSRLNQGSGPCLYVCPSKQLAKQASNDALKFGIKHKLDEGGKELPLEFTEGKEILITYVQRVFNGKSKFGIDNQYVRLGTIVLDDSHACIESIRSAFSIKTPKHSNTFQYMLSLFESSMRQQGEGTFLDIKGLEYTQDVMTVPYWDWIDKKNEVSQYFCDHQNDDEIKFAYPLLKDIWEHCTAFFTGSSLEITPDYNLIHRFQFFTNCEQRVLMSATTQEDSFFIKGLGFSQKSVCNPIINVNAKWSGEKMILFPSRIDESLSLYNMRKWLSRPSPSGLISNVALVSSGWHADEYKNLGAHLAIHEKLDGELQYLQTGPYNNAVVFVNRYDGIDLADNQCRILMIDSLPTLGNLADRYEQSCREDSNIITTKIAQKIEQGLGRSVRSEKDYCVILMVGEDLIRFVKTSANQKYFSNQTRKQIEIGEEVTESVKEEIGDASPLYAMIQVINQCLKRDDGWKQYYQESMDSIDINYDSHPLLGLIQKEYDAENAYKKSDYEVAECKYQDIVNATDNDLEKGWYLQLMAKCAYYRSKIESEKIQKKAHSLNRYVLMPINVHYTPKDITNMSSLRIVKKQFNKLRTFDELQLKVKAILVNLSFGVSSNKFEESMKDIGALLGFVSERPDQEFKVGPDNLWISPNSHKYFVIECKNEVLNERKYISKQEVGQMNNHIGWFEEQYGQEQDVEYIHVHQTKEYSSQANYNKQVRILTPEKLELLKQNIMAYIREFAKYDLLTVDENFISSAMQKHKLSHSTFVDKYTVKCSKQK